MNRIKRAERWTRAKLPHPGPEWIRAISHYLENGSKKATGGAATAAAGCCRRGSSASGLSAQEGMLLVRTALGLSGVFSYPSEEAHDYQEE